MNTLDYMNEGFRQPSDTKFYTETETDLIHQHTLGISEFVRKHLEEGETKNVYPIYRLRKKEPVFSMLPKIHKR